MVFRLCKWSWSHHCEKNHNYVSSINLINTDINQYDQLHWVRLCDE